MRTAIELDQRHSVGRETQICSQHAALARLCRERAQQRRFVRRLHLHARPCAPPLLVHTLCERLVRATRVGSKWREIEIQRVKSNVKMQSVMNSMLVTPPFVPLVEHVRLYAALIARPSEIVAQRIEPAPSMAAHIASIGTSVPLHLWYSISLFFFLFLWCRLDLPASSASSRSLTVACFGLSGLLCATSLCFVLRSTLFRTSCFRCFRAIANWSGLVCCDCCLLPDLCSWSFVISFLYLFHFVLYD